MNFSELYKKIAELDNRPMTESDTVESCGSPMGSSPIAQQDTVSVSVNMNGSGAGGIRDLMAILKNIEDTDGDMPDMPHMDMPSPGDMTGDLTDPNDMDSADDDKDALSQIMRLSGKPTMLPGNDGMDGVDKPQEGFANEPDENYSDISALTHDNAGGLNAPHKQYKKEYPGDNPMAESVKNKLLHKYQSYR
jgi:hypothetical protein